MHDVAKVEKLTNDFKKYELPMQVEPSVHSADDAFLNDCLDNGVRFLKDYERELRKSSLLLSKLDATYSMFMTLETSLSQ